MTPDPQATLASDVDPGAERQVEVEVEVEELLVEEVSIDGLCGVY